MRRRRVGPAVSLIHLFLVSDSVASLLPPLRPLVASVCDSCVKQVAVAASAAQAAPGVAVGAFTAGVAVGFSARSVRAATQLYKTADDVPGAALRSHHAFTAKVVSVADGDTLRVRHLPLGRLFAGGARFNGKLSVETIQLRLIAFDAPETAKFGKPGQKYGGEARVAVEAALKGRRVKVTPYARDQYGRIVGAVTFGWRRRDMSTVMVSRGLGAIYRGAGAQYGRRTLGWWESLERRAQERRMGMWSKGVAKVELPSEFKKRQSSR
jgi:micrococcal nuclease